jgi:DNA-binding LytR/AlgR family response regulator
VKFKLIIDKTKDEEIVATVREPSALTEQIQQLVLEYTGTDRITAYGEDDTKILKFQEIVCITVQDGKTYAVDVTAKQYRLKQRLYELEAVLPSSFIRINKSAIANETQIERFVANFSGAVDVVFRGGYREYVSRRCFAQIKRRYGL